jgi:hypothetical protein
MNLKRARYIGFNLGLSMAGTVDDIRAWKAEEDDDSPVTVDDAAEYAGQGFQNYQQYSPWEFTAKEFEESRDPEATWSRFYEGLSAGARQAHMWELSSTKYQRPDNIVVPVKNLRWIIRQRWEVDRITLTRNEDGSGEFLAVLNDGTKFHSHFADYTLCRKFANLSLRFRFASLTFIGGN